ncbi:hypothetical protein BD408DRAFT_320870, partial [Parasitella parasitica]
WLWKYEYPSNIDPHERELIQVIQFVLTDFASKCNILGMNGSTNLERTFWIDRVVPLFQIFGDQTGLLSYKWCEVFSQKYAEISADISNCKPGNARYVDGMGYDIHDEERLVMESN